jgi:chromosome segregation ATPase
MALAQEDLDLLKQQLGEYVKEHLGDWLAEQSLGKPPVVYEIELRERMVRVEEELKHQRELMREGFAQMDKRFGQVDKRFEQVDKRFESVQQDIRNLQQRMDSFMRWSFGITVGVGGVIIGVLKLWP